MNALVYENVEMEYSGVNDDYEKEWPDENEKVCHDGYHSERDHKTGLRHHCRILPSHQIPVRGTIDDHHCV